jgi:hypothetical protein
MPVEPAIIRAVASNDSNSLIIDILPTNRAMKPAFAERPN